MKVEGNAVIKELSLNEARRVVGGTNGGVLGPCKPHPTKKDKNGEPMCEKSLGGGK